MTANAVLLTRLSVFRAGFSVEAAESVCAGAPLDAEDVLPILMALVDRSLVQPYDVDGERRFRLLESVAQFASEQLEADGAADDASERHLAYWLGVAREIDAMPSYRDRAARCRRLLADLGNVRAVLEYGHARGRCETAGELTARLFMVWVVNGSHLGEGEGWLARATAADPPCSVMVRCLLRFWTAILLGLRQEYVAARSQMRRALPDLAEHRVREYREGAVSVVSFGRYLLDPTALRDVPSMLALVGDDEDSDEPSTALTAAGVVLSTWGRMSRPGSCPIGTPPARRAGVPRFPAVSTCSASRSPSVSGTMPRPLAAGTS